ncbi:MAG: AsmA-like C-terminal region-containing protein, partial [Planctomycetota bacterium]
VPAFAPKGGTLTGSWRMHGAPELAAMQAEGEFRFGGTSLRWADVPVPLEGVQGEVLVRFGDEVGHSATQPSYPRRPFGVTYRIDNRKESKSGARARVSGWVREERTPAVFDPSVPAETLQELSIDIDELGLRGQAFDLLAQRFPALRREAESYGAVGRVHVAFRGSQPRAGVPFVSEIEATPLAVHVTPQIFQRQTKEVTGRLLVRTADVPGGEESSAQLALTGQWPGGAELFAHGNVPASGPATIEVLGAGIDPTNTSFKGALSTSLNAANPTAGIDLSAWTLAGPVDFALAASFEPESPAPAENRYTIQLRDNDLHARDLVLADLQGTFHQEGVVLSSPLVRATLGGHPLELAQVETFPLGAAAGFAGADPWLAREGFWTDANGRALQAFVTTRDLPLDAEHLTGLLTPEALENLRANESWHGQIDVLGARLLVTSEFENDGKVAVRGPMQLEELGLRLGIPLRVARARVDLKELVQEEGRFRGWAEISAIDASLAERALTDAHLIASYVDGRLTIDDLAGDFEGGRLESLGGGGDLASKALGIDLAEPHRFDVGLRLTDVSVGGLLRGVFQSSIADEGVLDATLQLSGTPDDILGLTGRGSLSLDEGALWSIPVMRELFGQLGFDRAGLFDRLRARFELRDGRIQISHVELQSSLLDLVGAGWQDLDGELAYDLEVRYGLLDRLGVIGRALYWFNNNLMRVAVRGDFDRPTVSIRNSLVELLRRFDERPARLLPLPPFSTLGERF